MGKGVDEIRRIQETVDLAQYALGRGWELDRAKTSSSVVVLRSGATKILARKKGNKHPGWRFVECVSADLTGGRCGDVVDFVAWELGITIKEAMQELGGYEGTTTFPLGHSEAPTGSSKATRADVVSYWAGCRWIPNHGYLRRRKLDTALGDPRFVDRYRMDARGNAVFPLYDRQGLVGCERRNVEFRGMIKGSNRAFWHSNNLSIATTIIITESPIDCMSHAELYSGDAAYIALCGTVTLLQKDLLKGLIHKAANRSATIIAGFDNDSMGNEYYRLLQSLSSVELERAMPATKDWNSDLSSLTMTAT